MFDSRLRPLIDPPLNALAAALARRGVTANILTLAGFLCGAGAGAALTVQSYGIALLLFALSRLADGLDGPVARQGKGATRLGGFYDIVSDFVLYSALVFCFAVGRPDTALAACFLILSFVGSGVTFLAYAILAAGEGINSDHQGKKSFHYAAGLCEGTETIIFFVAIFLFPAMFLPLALVFAALCWVTTAGRLLMARRDFSGR